VSACEVARQPILKLMPGEFGRDWSMPPLLPAGFTVFESLPVDALVLEALAPAIGNGIITMSESESEGVLVVRNGVVAERVWIANGVRSHGDEALALIRAADGAMVSARRLDDAAMGLLGALLHGIPCYIDLRLEWVAWPQFLGDLCTRGQTFVVELETPVGRGVTCVRDGRQLATFTESHPTLGDASLLDDLAVGGVGTIRVLVDVGGLDEVAHAPTGVIAPTSADAGPPDVSTTVASLALTDVTAEGANDPVPETHTVFAMQREAATAIVSEPPRAEHLANDALAETTGASTLVAPPADYVERYVLPAAQSALIPSGASRPPVIDAADPNATFTAMFGSHHETPAARSIALDSAPHAAEQDVASLLPQLRLLVQHRLQRSSSSVEEIVERAATDHQNVGWLSDRVRVITMRGFLHSTFDQLADDMLALAGRDPD
jgi:hypothetical protein